MFIELTEDNFPNEVIESNVPVLVDFWATWCQPCRLLETSLKSVATTYGDNIKFCKLNADDNQALTARFNVRSLPTLMLFVKGEPVRQLVGAVPVSKIVELIEKK